MEFDFPGCPMIEITPPTTEGNFLGYNVKTEEDLNSDFLIAPMNEADYDSETQFCVDNATAKPEASFYDHFVTKRKKKKRGFKRSTIAPPAPPPVAAPRQADLLTVPGLVGVPKGVLANASVRRLACGRMPPTEPPEMLLNETTADQ